MRGYPVTDAESVANWYRPHPADHRRDPPLLGADLLATLNDSAENCSLKYAGKVFHELFLKSSAGGRLGIPTVPLSEFYAAARRWSAETAAASNCVPSVEQISQQSDGRWLLRSGDAEYRGR
jgi:hypothetical protein